MTDAPVRLAYALRAEEYTTALGTVDDMHEMDRRRIAQWASGLSGQVIDTGCGPGHWTDFLHRQGISVSGVDLVPEFIDAARIRFPGVDFRVASLHSLDVAEGSLGGVLAWYSLILMSPDDLLSALSALSRSLAPRAQLLIGFFEGPTAQPFDHAIATAYYWSTDRMNQLLHRAGLEVLDVETRHDAGSRPHAAIAATAR